MECDYYEKCVKKLEIMGFKVNHDILCQCVDKACNYVKKFCNIRKIPESLSSEVVDYACGSALEIMKNCGLIESESLNTGLEAKQIKEGDVTVTYWDNSSDSSRIDRIISTLKNIDDILVMYRKVVW